MVIILRLIGSCWSYCATFLLVTFRTGYVSKGSPFRLDIARRTQVVIELRGKDHIADDVSRFGFRFERRFEPQFICIFWGEL